MPSWHLAIGNGFQKKVATADITEGYGFETEEGDGGRSGTLSFRVSSVFNPWLFPPANENASIVLSVQFEVFSVPSESHCTLKTEHLTLLPSPASPQRVCVINEGRPNGVCLLRELRRRLRSENILESL
jgi:hypothetical protein